MKRLVLVLFSCFFPLLAFAADPVCPDLTMLQKAAGYVDFLGFVQVMTIIGVAGGLACIFAGAIRTILSMHGLMEFLLWATTIGFVAGSYFVGTDHRSWTLPIGALLIPCACMLSAKLHGIKIEAAKSLTVLTCIWGALALFFSSPFVGFITVGALLGALGFSIMVTPLCYAFGFTDKDAVPRGTAAGLVIMSVYILMRFTGTDLHNVSVFESGALWLGSFAGFLGLLIMSSSFYNDRKDVTGPGWGIMNVIAVVFFAVVISIGMIFGIREVTTIASAFLLFYIAEKVLEVEADGLIAFGVKLLVCGMVGGGAWQWLRTHQELVTQYLTV